jgi:hypothetical protein
VLLKNDSEIKNKVMKKNMGPIDRMVRLGIAAVLIAVFFLFSSLGTFGYVALTLAAVMVITSFVSLCPLYLPFGISTCKK